MKRTWRIFALFPLIFGPSIVAHADEYVLRDTVRIELPGLVQLINKTTKCRVIGELHTQTFTGVAHASYEVVAKREICPNGDQKEVRLQGALIPSVEGRVMAGTVIELIPTK